MVDRTPVTQAPISVVATDLDGTLLRPDLTVSAFTRQQLHRVVTSGRMLVFVTGRPPHWMPPVIETTGHDGVAVCANGAVVLDVASRQVVAIAPSGGGPGRDLCRHPCRMGPQTRFGFELAPLGPMSGNRLVHEEGFLPPLRTSQDGRTPGRTGGGRRGGQTARPRHRPRGRHRTSGGPGRRGHGGAVTISHSSRTHQLLEIAPPGVTKATTLADWWNPPVAAPPRSWLSATCPTTSRC